MRRPSFLEGVVLALVAALGAAVAHGVLSTLFEPAWVTRLLIAGLGLGYLLYLLGRSPTRVGRVTTILGWLSMAGAGWSFLGPLTSYLAMHLGMLWLVRSLYHQPGPLAAGLDLGLNLLAAAVAAWALLHTGSVFLGVWSFFLVQALYVAIPAAARKPRSEASGSGTTNDRFQEARRNAENALRRLSSTR